MADINTKPVLSVCATVSSRVKDLVIKQGQLVFVQDTNKIAFDFNGRRKFYNSITTLESENERKNIEPINEHFYFVIDTAVLWTYQDRWIQLTTSPEEIIFIGTELPALGQNNKTLYVNKQEQKIAVWDSEISKYITVSDKTQEISEEEITSLFIKK